MGKFMVLVECRNEGGTDLHCWIVEAKNPGEAEHIAVSRARAFYPLHFYLMTDYGKSTTSTLYLEM
jgi:hypothetical protein